MRIVYVCEWNPWTLAGGALIRNAWLVRALAGRYEVHLVTADDDRCEVPADFAAACASISRFPRRTKFMHNVQRTLEALRPQASFYSSGNAPSALRRKVRELMTRSSVAMVDLKMIDALDGVGMPFIYNAHNTENQLFQRRADYEPQPVRSLMRMEAARVRRIEARTVRNARLVAACSENDRRELVELVPEASSKIFVVPNGVDTLHYGRVPSIPKEPRTLLITGSYDWRPNLLGLEWFLTDVMPALRERMAGHQFAIRVAGRMKSDLVTKLSAFSEITAVPNPPDMIEELARAAIVLAPIVASSGTRLRILEAWAAGRPVVTTAAGALGLTCRDGEELLLGEKPDHFADAICVLLNQPAVWQRIRAAALARAADYDWMRIGKRFVQRASPQLLELTLAK